MSAIKEIYVKKLFDYLDYDIPLNTTDNITIIHGPNGCGKTWILQLINAVFSRDFATLRTAPFSEIGFRFRDGGNFTVRRYYEESQPLFQLASHTGWPRPSPAKLVFSYYSRRTKKPKEFSLPLSRLSATERSFPLSLVEREIPSLVRIGFKEWRDRFQDRILTLEDVVSIYGHRLPYFPSSKQVPFWLQSLTDRIQVDFIQSQRLIRMPISAERHEPPSKKDVTEMVELDSRELAEKMSRALTESVKIAQSRDRTFPTRLLQRDFSEVASEAQLREELGKIDAKRQKLYAAGLLEEEQAVPLPSKSMNDMEQKVLTLYVQDQKDKLRVFDDLQNRIATLMDLVNSKIEPQGKTLTVDKERGFVFKTKYGVEKTLRPIDLSSGEQHQLVLFYELLFKPTRSTLFLIDEPEISLNVGWQRRFLQDLSKALRLGKHSVLMATHSPQIIHNRWDLGVALSGGVKE